MSSIPVLADPDDSALFLDVDGTLVAIEDRPERVVSPPALVSLLRAAGCRLDGALALISGRTITELDRIFAPERFAAAGAHGVEYRLPGDEIRFHSDVEIPAGVECRLAAAVDAHEGTFLEKKNHGIALHYRKNPDAGPALAAALEDALEDLGDGFDSLSGKMVHELVPRGHDKGAAIRFFMQHPPFAGRRPVFVGDDVTDEAGFAAVNEAGGLSIRIGDPDGSRARCSFPDIERFRRWLADTYAAPEPA